MAQKVFDECPEKFKTRKNEDIQMPTFSFMSSSSNVSVPDPDLEEEIDEFLKRKFKGIKESRNLIEFWSKIDDDFLILKELARQILVLPATSAPAERVFSEVFLLDTDLQNRLSIERINSMVMAKKFVKEELTELYEETYEFISK